MVNEEGQDRAGGGQCGENGAVATPALENMQLRVDVFFVTPRANGDKIAVCRQRDGECSIDKDTGADGGFKCPDPLASTGVEGPDAPGGALDECV